MATYAIRFIGPVVERARRWSQSSVAEELPAPSSPSASATAGSPTSEGSPPSPPTSPLHRLVRLDSVSEAIDVDDDDDDVEGADLGGGGRAGALAVLDPLPPAVHHHHHHHHRHHFGAAASLPNRQRAASAPPPLGPLHSRSSRILPSHSGTATVVQPTPPPPPPSAAAAYANALSPSPSPPPRSQQHASPVRSSPLPEDDGQGVLRRRLVEITKLGIPEREKARRMHFLMTEKYNASRKATVSVVDDNSNSPLSPDLPMAMDAEGHLLPSSSSSSSPDNPYKLSQSDLVQTYYTETGSAPESAILELGCPHYRRGVKLQCSTCERWYSCRFCHDEKEEHGLIRAETKNMLCMHCSRPQPAQQDCRYCGVQCSRYYCGKCKLWDDDPNKSIYHCNDCGICRIGKGLGKDLFHCKKCGMCMPIILEGAHRCIERSIECDCPICGDFMFTSTSTIVFMTCGHWIHRKCYNGHVQNSYRCPTCARTIINMESNFRALDAEIESQPLPDPYRSWRCLIGCNDCLAKSNVSFHFLGLKCENCGSYNTNQVRMLRPEDGADYHHPATDAGQSLDRSSSAPLLSSSPQVSTSQPRLPRAEGDSVLANANQAIITAGEAIIALGRGDGGLMFDDGWETEDSADFSSGDEEIGSDKGKEEEEEDEDEDEDEDEEDEEDDDDDHDLIQLTGHR